MVAMNNRTLIAMSGGVDSSVAAYLMKEAGYECTGATMKLFFNEDIGIAKEHSCCSVDDVMDAESVAGSMGMRHYVFNFAERFRETVMEPFAIAYETGRTPNPCIDCNRFLKFDKLFARAKALECDHIATGHYARIEYDESSGRYLLKRAVDENKDQSYVLYAMTQWQLEHTFLPLGSMSKANVREIAEKQGFINARKHDSQDICFVQSGHYSDFIRELRGKDYPAGYFKDRNGNILGEHKGIINYTIGQRKGLGIAFPQPMYVTAILPEENTVVLGTGDELFSDELYADDINLISVERIEKPMRVKAKVRYRQKEQWATVTQPEDDLLRIVFDEPQRAVTAGQAVVMYDGDIVVGGGTIR